MKSHLEDISSTRKKATVTIPAQTITSVRAAVVQQMAKKAQIHGFRPGKAPAAIVAQRYPELIEEELHHRFYQEAASFAIQEGELEVFGVVDSSDIDLTKNEDVTIIFEIDVQPTFELPDYQAIEIPVLSEEVTAEEISETIEKLQIQHSSFKAIEKAADKNDYVQVSYTATIDGTPLEQIHPEAPHYYAAESKTWELAGVTEAHSIAPELHDALIGMKAGDKKTVIITFSADQKKKALENLIGKSAEYAIEVHEVRHEVIPELNDDFAERMGTASVENLKEKVKGILASKKKNERFEAKLNHLAKALLEKVDFDMPLSAINQTFRYTLMIAFRTLMFEDFEDSEKGGFVDRVKISAYSKAKLNFILLKIAQKEQINLEENDLIQFFNYFIKSNKLNSKEFLKMIKEDQNMLQQFRIEALTSKTLIHVASLTKEVPALEIVK